MSDIRVFRAQTDTPADDVDLAVTIDAGGQISVDGGTVTIGGVVYAVPSAAITLSLDPAKAATVFGVIRKHKTSGAVDLALFQFNAGDPIDFGASYDILYQYIRSVIPAGTAVTDISLDCWIKKAAA